MGAHVLAPGGTDDGDVAEQHTVELDGRDAARGEADHHIPTVGRHLAQRLVEDVAADRIDHDVDALGRELLEPVTPAVGQLHHVVGAQVAQHLLGAGAMHDRDDRRAHRLGDQNRRHANTTGGTEDADDLARRGLRAQLQGEQRGLEVDTHRGAFVERELVG